MSKPKVKSSTARLREPLETHVSAAHVAVEGLESAWKSYARSLEDDLERANKKLAKLRVDPDAYEESIIDEYLRLLHAVHAEGTHMRAAEPTEFDTSVMLFAAAMFRVVRFLSSELGIESRLQSVLTESWPYVEGGPGYEAASA